MNCRLLNILLIVVFIILALTRETFPQEIKEEVKAIITNTFNNDAHYDYERYTIPSSLKSKIENTAQQKFFSESVYILNIFNKDNLTGVAILDNVYGKEMPITFLVIFDNDCLYHLICFSPFAQEQHVSFPNKKQ